MLWHLQIDPASGRTDLEGLRIAAEAADLGLPGPWRIAASRGFLVEGTLTPSQGKGPRYIQMKLKEKGVSASLGQVTEVLDEVSGASQLETAREIVERRYSGFESDVSTRARAYQALLRRGFSHEIARHALLKRPTEI